MNKQMIPNYSQLLSNGFMVSEMIESKLVFQFIKNFKNKFIPVDLIRIGSEHDGGYLVPNFMHQISRCFSPGVSNIIDFEKQLSDDFDIKSYLLDASINELPFSNKNFIFEKKFLGITNNDLIITLQNWMKNNSETEDNDLLLQMDIEGSEYEILVFESIETLKKFSCMVIEFHCFDKLFDPYFFKMVSGIFEKIYSEFSICHVHPNNCCGIFSYGGVDIPRVFEVTFIRNDKIKEVKINDKIQLPHKYDRANLVYEPSIKMPIEWWKKD